MPPTQKPAQKSTKLVGKQTPSAIQAVGASHGGLPQATLSPAKVALVNALFGGRIAITDADGVEELAKQVAAKWPSEPPLSL